MALQKNITLDGGIVANNCYVRIHSVEADRQNGDSDWSLKILVNVYKDADARNAKSPALKDGDGNVVEPEGSTGSGAVHLNDKIKNKEYKFSYDPDSEQGDLIALAYAKLKTHEDFSGASDV
mgnify:CR=1 FL=1